MCIRDRQGPGRGDSDGRAYSQLSFFLSENEQIRIIDEAENVKASSAFSFAQADIDHVLRLSLIHISILPEPWQMVVSKDKKKQFNILKQLMNAPDVTEVVNACDAGREGELIFRSVYELAGCQKPMKRLWISSMEDSAIREGFANPVSYTHLDVYKRQLST